MTKSLPFVLLSAGALIAGTAAIADAQTAAKPVAVKTTTKTSTTTTRNASGQFVKKTAATGRMVTAKTATGKTVTYDCSKAGNATKAACKK